MIHFPELNNLLQREVSRKEFLRYIGIALIGLIGITSLLDNMHSVIGTPRKATEETGFDYGMTPYGG